MRNKKALRTEHLCMCLPANNLRKILIQGNGRSLQGKLPSYFSEMPTMFSRSSLDGKINLLPCVLGLIVPQSGVYGIQADASTVSSPSKTKTYYSKNEIAIPVVWVDSWRLLPCRMRSSPSGKRTRKVYAAEARKQSVELPKADPHALLTPEEPLRLSLGRW